MVLSSPGLSKETKMYQSGTQQETSGTVSKVTQQSVRNGTSYNGGGRLRETKGDGAATWN